MEQHKLYIGSEWVPASGGDVFAANNPATGEQIAEVALGTLEDIDRAVNAARSAATVLAGTSVENRASWCETAAAAIEANVEQLARALTEDQGKPLDSEARGEILLAAKGFRDAAGHIRHLDGTIQHAENPNKKVLSVHRPRGVYAVITPWNFPINIPTEYLAPALATGNAVVWVPAPSTSHVAVKFTEVLTQGGIPVGALNLVTGPGAIIGDALVGHEGVDAVGFTGSTATGLSIAKRAAGKPLLLELGGNGPTIVLDDADLPAAAKAIAAGAYFNGGQVCAATEVVLVERGVHDQLAELVLAETRKIVQGDPLDPRTTMGPLNNEATASKMDAHISDAAKRGATIAAGGGRTKPGSLYYQPTVLTNVAKDAEVVSAESFGPLVPLVPVDSAEEAIQLAQAPQFGLCGAVWSRSASRAFAVAERMRNGLVNINDSSTYWEIHIPFGGGSGTYSGLGRLGGMHTLRAMTEIKTITFETTNF